MAACRPTWTPDRVEALKALAQKNWSATMIAADLGNDISRCAVLGKLFRLGISTGNTRSPVVRAKYPDGMAPRKRVRKQKVQFSNFEKRVRVITVVEEVVEPDEVPEQSEFAVTFEDLNDSQCHYPLGDPLDHESFRYCGAPKTKLCYCSRHYRVMYHPAPLREARP